MAMQAGLRTIATNLATATGASGAQVAIVRVGNAMRTAVAGTRQHKAGSALTRLWRGSGPEPLPCAESDQWHLGSCSKAVTATLAALLVEDGAISWDTTLGDAIDARRDAEPAEPRRSVGEAGAGGGAPELAPVEPHEGFRGVTLLQFLRHRSGLTRAHAPGAWELAWQLERELREGALGEAVLRAHRRRYLQAALSMAPESVPGPEEHEYSNDNYVAVASMLEAVADQPFEELCRARIFEPLGMTSAGFGAIGGSKATVEERRQFVWGHSDGAPKDPAEINADNPSVCNPAGRIHCSMEDWAKFIEVHLSAATAQERLGMSAATWEQLHTSNAPPTTKGQYAGGWLVMNRRWAGDKPALTHSGSNTMNYAMAWLAPGIGVSFLLACNVGASAVGAHANTAVVEMLKLANEHRKTGAASAGAGGSTE